MSVGTFGHQSMREVMPGLEGFEILVRVFENRIRGRHSIEPDAISIINSY